MPFDQSTRQHQATIDQDAIWFLAWQVEAIKIEIRRCHMLHASLPRPTRCCKLLFFFCPRLLPPSLLGMVSFDLHRCDLTTAIEYNILTKLNSGFSQKKYLNTSENPATSNVFFAYSEAKFRLCWHCRVRLVAMPSQVFVSSRLVWPWSWSWPVSRLGQ